MEIKKGRLVKAPIEIHNQLLEIVISVLVFSIA